MSTLGIVAYTDRWDVEPGQLVGVRASSSYPTYFASLLRHKGAIRSPADWLAKSEPITFDHAGPHPGELRTIKQGSYFGVDLDLSLSNENAILEFLFLPTRLTDATALCEVSFDKSPIQILIDLKGGLSVVGEGIHVSPKENDLRVQTGRWQKITLSVAPVDNQLSVSVSDRQNSIATEVWQVHDVDSVNGILLGARTLDSQRLASFDGKISGPKIFRMPRDARRDREIVASWDFGNADQSQFDVVDTCNNLPAGRLVNGPMRYVTGPNWTGGASDRNAVKFHSDDLADCEWPADFTVEIPEDLPNGVYSLILSRDPEPDWFDRTSYDAVPLFQRRPSLGDVKIALVLPTFSYRAYANATAFADCNRQVFKLAGETVSTPYYDTALRLWLRSTYDLHRDGTGIHLATLKRPQLNIRADFVSPLQGFPHQFSADLEIIEWLERHEISYDILTDEYLHCQGSTALDPYQVVLTGSHPEYVSPEAFDAFEEHLKSGGSLAYLGGNGFYWSVALGKSHPELMEVRRHRGTRTWTCAVGEKTHQLDGRPGGDWRGLDRPPNLLTGIGFAGLGFSGDGDYTVSSDINEELPANLVRVLKAIGESPFGVAGLEVDSHDPILGSDPHLHVIACTRRLPEGYHQAIENIEALDNLLPDPSTAFQGNVQGNIVFGTRSTGGNVFSVGSIRWVSGLNKANDPDCVDALTLAAIRDLSALTSKDIQGH